MASGFHSGHCSSSTSTTSAARRRLLRRLLHENLERRELMAFDIRAGIIYAPDTPQSYVDQMELNRSLSVSGPQPFEFLGTRWTNPTGGISPNSGDPATLTWSIVPDGTPVPDSQNGGPNQGSNFIAFMDGIYGTAAGALTNRPWFPLVAKSYERWSELSGLNFVYEPSDDGMELLLGTARGELGVRGDVRVSGRTIDGTAGILAYAFEPASGGSVGLAGDIVFDTADTLYAANSDGATGENRLFYTTMLHEAGHGVGLGHVLPTDGTKLMEPFSDPNIRDVSHDEILGVQSLYGDNYENNDSPLTASNLGILQNGIVRLNQNSIDGSADEDWYSFNTESEGRITVTLSPNGFQYMVGPQTGGPIVSVDTLRNKDLQFRLETGNGTLLSSRNLTGLGEDEVLTSFNLPAAGQYRLRVIGSGSSIQLYDLSIRLAGLVSTTTNDLAPRLLSVAANSGEIFTFNQINTLGEAPRELIFRFDGAQQIDPDTLSGIRIARAGIDGAFGTSDDVLIVPGWIGFGETPRIVIARFAETLPDDAYRVEVLGVDLSSEGRVAIQNVDGLPLRPRQAGSDRDTIFFNLELGAQIVSVVPQPIQRNGAGVLTQQRDKIVVYFNKDDLHSSAVKTGDVSPNPTVVDPQYYQLHLNQETVRNTDDVVFLPSSIEYDPLLDRAILTFAKNIDELDTTPAKSTSFRLRVGTNEAIPIAPQLNSPADPGSSFESGQHTDLGQFSTLTSKEIRQEIRNATAFPLDFPGAPDMPGDRENDAENHVTSDSPDAGVGIAVQYYNFNAELPYGINTFGQPQFNAISPDQKLRAREVFEFYGNQLGIKFIESEDAMGGSSWTIVTGELSVFGSEGGQGGTLAIAGSGAGTFNRPTVVLDASEDWNDEFGASDNAGKPSWFVVAMHEIGHLLGLGHATELPPGTTMGGLYSNQTNGGEAALLSNPVEPVFPGPHDVVHGKYLHKPDSRDIDLYRFEIAPNSKGDFTAEVVAERLGDSSLLDSFLTLYKRSADGTMQVLAVNDDYFSEDSYMRLQLDPGEYFLGVTASGNDDYDPVIRNTGLNGTSEGSYQLRTTFRPLVQSSIEDTSGTPLDGDADGKSGGVFDFWFQAAAPSGQETGQRRTLFVQKGFATNLAQTPGTLTNPYNNIPSAFTAARAGDIVRFVPNGGLDGNVSTLGDNFAFEVGKGGLNNQQTLSDGATMDVPKGVNLMIDAGVMFKMGGSAIGVGSSTISVDTSRTAIQVLGTPTQSVIFTSYNDESLGFDTNPVPTTPSSGDWGGIMFRNQVDRDEGRFDYELDGIFIDYVSHTDFRYGGGRVNINGQLQVVTPLHMVTARPTLVFNTITRSADAALSATPDSFAESTFVEPRYQINGTFTSDYDRVGPEVHGNRLLNNTTNGLFVRIDTLSGNARVQQTVPGRWDDTDIVHVLGENLLLQGTSGGPFEESVRPSLAVVNFSGVNVAGGSLLPTTSYRYQMTFIDANGNESVASLPTLAVTPGVGKNALQLTNIPAAKPGFVARRLYRSSGGAFQLVAELDRSSGSFSDSLPTKPAVLVDTATRKRARLDASLTIDPGIIVKSKSSRIEATISTQLVAEGSDGFPIIFTSLQDDRYGRGGTFDSNGNGSSTSPAPGDWGGIYFGQLSDGSLEHTLVTYAGGRTGLSGAFAAFNAIEIHQAQVRIADSIIENNATGFGGDAGSNRDGHGFNEGAAIFVRGAQPIIVDNIIRDNDEAAISINPDSMVGIGVRDDGRMTGFANARTEITENKGPLVRGNLLGGNLVNGMVVRGETLNSDSVWDDTDVVHVVFDEIVVPDYHVYGGLRLQSSPNESLVVKFGPNAGLTSTGRPLDIDDRIGGILQVVGTPGFPVILTSIKDDTIGAGFDPFGRAQVDTNGNGPSVGASGDWRSIRIEQYSHDRNVDITAELEPADSLGAGVNAIPDNAQRLGILAPNEKAGDDNQRLGYTIEGTINNVDDVDVYSFVGVAGTEVWLDIDRSSVGLDSVVELIDANGRIIALSDNSFGESTGTVAFYSNPAFIVPNAVNAMQKDPQSPRNLGHNLGGTFADFYSTNLLDAGLRVVLPGASGTRNSFYVRVRSSNIDSNDAGANRADLQDTGKVRDGKTEGQYQLQIRMQEMDEVAGSLVRYSDIRYATVGIEVLGMPGHSPLMGEAIEALNGNADINDTQAAALNLGNFANTDRAALSIAGNLATATDVDWYRFDINIDSTQTGGTQQHLSTIIDIDYTDGLSRANTSLWLYYTAPGGTAPELVAFGTDSNIADDLGAPLNGSDMDDLSRGSAGVLDAFLGSVEMPSGTYYLAITSNQQIPADFLQFHAHNANLNPLLRVEPIDSVERLVHDDISTTANPGTSTFSGPVTKAVTVMNGSPGGFQNGVPFTLADIPLFIVQPGPGNDQSELLTVSTMTGNQTSGISRFPYVEDIAMRGDGTIHGARVNISGAPQNDAASGGILTIDDAGDGATAAASTTSGITTYVQDPNQAVANPPTRAGLVAPNANSGNNDGQGIQFYGLTYPQQSNAQMFLYAVGSRGDTNPTSFNNDIPPTSLADARNYVYKLDPLTFQALSAPGANRQNAAVLDGAGTQIVERGYIDTSRDVAQNARSRSIIVPDATSNTSPDIVDGDAITINANGIVRTIQLTNPLDSVELIADTQAFGNPPAPQNFYVDGETFSLTGAGGTRVFEIDTGRVLNVSWNGVIDAVGGANGGADQVTDIDGAQFFIIEGGIRYDFEFDSDGMSVNPAAFVIAFSDQAANPNAVPPIPPPDTPAQIAASTVAAINNFAGNVVARLLPGTTRISLVNEDFVDIVPLVVPFVANTTAQLHPLTISGEYGALLGTNVTLPLEEYFTNNNAGPVFVSVINGAAIGVTTSYITNGRLVYSGVTAKDFSNISTISDVTRTTVPGAITVPFNFTDSAAVLTGKILTAVQSIEPLAVRHGNVIELPRQSFFVQAQTDDRLDNPSAGISLSTPQYGTVTGLGFAGSTMYAVSDQGDLYQVGGGAFSPNARGQNGDFIETIYHPLNGQRVQFAGLTSGPRNAENSTLANTLFAIDSSGMLYAFDALGRPAPVFPNALWYIQTDATNPQGLAFSNMDVNLWHVTGSRSGDDGHGTPTTFDGSRTTAATGGTSLYFGFEDPRNAGVDRRQPGDFGGINNPANETVANYDNLVDNTYDFPGGTRGSVISNPLDLSSYSAGDKPTLYFSYYLVTENTNNNLPTPDNMQDAFRVFASGDDGVWKLLASNNSDFDDNRGNSQDELDYFNNNNDNRYQIQQLFDANETFNNDTSPDSWRQARMDLSPLAGNRLVRLRFDFSSAARFDVGIAGAGGVELTAVPGDMIRERQTFQIATRTFEFDLGLVIQVPSIARLDNGYTFEVEGVTYTFSSSSNAGNNVLFAATDTPATIAQRIRTKLQARGLTTNTDPRVSSRLSVMNAVDSTPSLDPRLPADFFSDVPGVVAGRQTVLVHNAMDANQVREAIRIAIAQAFHPVGEKTNLAPIRFFGPTIYLYNQSITAGTSRLGVLTTLAGDQFGIPESASFTNPGGARGQLNRFEGVYVDDIIVGFAEHGEFVFANTSVDTLFADNPGHEPDPSIIETETGTYQVEIRTSADYGTTGAFPILGLFRTYNTNDRLTKQFSIVPPPGSEISDGKTFTISDGVDTVTFEYDDTDIPVGAPGSGVAQGRVRVSYTTKMNRSQVALRVRDAINSLQAQAVLNVVAGISDGGVTGTTNLGTNTNSTIVNLYGAAAVNNQAGSVFEGIQFRTVATVNPLVTSNNNATGYVVSGFDTFRIEDGGDSNRFRDQGQVLVFGNVVRDAATVGILVDAGARTRTDLVPLAGDLPHPGGVRNLFQFNAAGLAPGVTVTNNLVTDSGGVGIRFSGDSRTAQNQVAPTPFGRIVNNTVVGRNGGGIGIEMTDNASPTLLNNIVASLATGIAVDATSTSTIIASTLYKGNQTNTTGTGLGTSFIQLLANQPLFVDPVKRNYYLAAGSRAIDSSIDSVSDRTLMTTVRTPHGIAVSPILAPDVDVTGQLRVDDPAVTSPGGQGSNPFKDRGAYDRADFDGPVAVLVNPVDNDDDNHDIDRNSTYVRLLEGTLDSFSILIQENNGTGPDPSTINENSVFLTENGRLLHSDIDYIFGYNVGSRTIRLTPLAGVWRSDSVYEITLNNLARTRVVLGNGLSVTDGQQIAIQLANNSAAVLEFETGYVLQIARTLTLVVPVAGAGPGGILDGQSFTINNGASVNAIFEFDTDNSIGSGHRRIVIPSFASQAEVQNAILTALINPSNADLNLAPKVLPNGRIHLGSLASHGVDAGSAALGVEGVSAGIEDGQSFTYTPVGGAQVRFEFNLVGSSLQGAGNREIQFLRTDTYEDIGAKLVPALSTVVQGGISPVAHLGTGKVQVGGKLGDLLDVETAQLTLTGSPGVTPALTIQVPANGGMGIAESDYFTVSLNGVAVVFEFTKDVVTTPGNIPITISNSDTSDQVADRIQSVVAAAGLGLTPEAIGGGRLTLGETRAHVVDLTGSPLTSTGVAGGAIAIAVVPSSQMSPLELAANVIAGINNSGLAIHAFSVGDGTLLVEGAASVTGGSATVLPIIQDIAGLPLLPNRATVLTQFTIVMPDVELDYGDAPGVNSPTLQANDGARHALLPIDRPLLALGSLADPDPDGVLDPAAQSDDLESTVIVETLPITIGQAGPAALVMPAPSAAIVGQTVRITDPRLNSITFQFSNGPVAPLPGAQAIDISSLLGNPNATADDVANLFAGAVLNALFANRLIDLVPIASANRVSLGGTPQHRFDLSGAPSLARLASGRLELIIGSNLATYADGQTVVLSDGFGNQVRFELNNTATSTSVAADNVPFDVDLTTATPASIAVALANAINQKVAERRLALNQVELNGTTLIVDNDDDDGVQFIGLFNSYSEPVRIDITSTGVGFVDAWIDWNGDGDFGDTDEKIRSSMPVKEGLTSFEIQTPAGAQAGFNSARFRLSSVGNLLSNGIGIGGEVEDYLIEIVGGRPPLVFDDSYAVNEDSTLTVPVTGVPYSGVLANDLADVGGSIFVFDMDLATPGVQPLVAPQFGQLTLNANGSFTYTPIADYFGSDTFVYLATDGLRLMGDRPATATIQVQPVNDPPILTNDTFNGVEDSVVTIPGSVLTSGDAPGPTNESGQSLTLVGAEIVDPRGNVEAVSVVNGQLIYTPPSDYNNQIDGPVLIRLSIQDGGIAGGNASPQTAISTLTINVAALNDAPFYTGAGNIVVDEDSGAYSATWATAIAPAAGLRSVPPTATDESTQTVSFDVTTDKPTFFSVQPSINANGLLTFTPAANAIGLAKVTVIARDDGPSGGANQNATSPQTFNLTINQVDNDAPSGSPDNYSANEDFTLQVNGPGLLVNDTDPDLPDDTIQVVAGNSVSVSGAAVTLNADGSFVYDPRNAIPLQGLRTGQSMVDTFTYRVRDAAGLESDLITVSVNVAGVNDPPFVRNDSFFVAPGMPKNLDVLANDVGVENPIVPSTLQLRMLPIHGTATVLPSGLIRYSPEAGFLGTETISYRVSDNQGTVSVEAFVTITVNQAPIAVGDVATTSRDTSITINVLANDNDPDGTLNPSSVAIVTAPGGGNASVNTNGSITYTPPAGFTGNVSFAYTVSDTLGAISNPGSVSVRVVSSLYQNQNIALDVNADGFVSPIDALLIINDLNLNGPRTLQPGEFTPPPFIDPSGDGQVTPLDALLIVNFLNLRNAGSEGEGESPTDQIVQTKISGGLSQIDVSIVTPEQMIATVCDHLARDVRNAFARSISDLVDGIGSSSNEPSVLDEFAADQAVVNSIDGKLESELDDVFRSDLEDLFA